jgi:hypothetical protein
MSTPTSAAPRTPHPRSRLVLTAAWLLATVLAATVAWWAVTAVGGERGGEVTGLVTQAEVERQLADAGGTGGGTGGGTDGGAAGGTDGSPTTADPSPSPDVPGAAPSPAPVEPAPVEPAPGAAAGDPASGGATTPTAPAEVARTWDVSGGQVGAVCTGSTIGLLYATPAGGWGVEVEHAGPAEVEVEFAGGDRETRVRARCVAGTPELTRNETGGGDDDDRGGDDAGDDD